MYMLDCPPSHVKVANDMSRVALGLGLSPLTPLPPGLLTSSRVLTLDAGMAGRAGVVVGEGAGGRAQVKVQWLDRHGGVR